MLCPQHMLHEMVFLFPHSHSFPAAAFFVCWCWFRFGCFLDPPLLLHPQKPSRQKRKEKEKEKKAKGMKRPIHWLTTDPWLSFEILCLQIKLSGFKEQEVPQSCPGPLNVTGQLWGVNAHFSQLSRTCDGGKGKQRRTEVTTLTNITGLCST